MTNNEVTTKVREMCEANPEFQKTLWAAWGEVCDRIEKRALARRPKPKSFEVHHECEVARLALLKAVVGGATPEAARLQSAEAIGMEWT